MKRFLQRFALLLVVVLCALASKPSAQIQDTPELPGTYAVSGTSPEGKPYTGMADIVAVSGGRFLVRWVFPATDGDPEKDVQVLGIGIVVNGALSVAYFSGVPAVAVYTVEKANPLTLSGRWAVMVPQADAIYTEQMVKVPADHPPAAAPKKKAKSEATTQA